MRVFIFLLVAFFFIFMFFFSLVSIGEYGMGSMFWLIVSGIVIYHMFKGFFEDSKSSSSGSTSSGISPNVKRPSNGVSSSDSDDPLKYIIYADLANRITPSSRIEDLHEGREVFDNDDWNEVDDCYNSYDDWEDDW